MSDPAKYRTKEEVEEFKGRDPIETMRLELLKQKLISDKEFTNIVERVKDEVKKSEQFAEDSPEPPLETMFEDVLV